MKKELLEKIKDAVIENELENGFDIDDLDIDIYKNRDNEIRQYLSENTAELLNICRDIDAYDGSMDFCRTYDILDCCEFMSKESLVRSIVYGDVHNMDTPVRFDGYENFETVYDCDLEQESEVYIDDVIDYIDNRYVTFPDDINEIVNMYDELYSVSDIIELNEFAEQYKNELE